MYKKSYVSEDGAKALRAYKYSGGDGSMIYKYVISPAAQKFCDTVVPSWLAPNCITSIGLVSALTAHLLLWTVLGDQLGGYYPPWVAVFCAICTAFYSFMDNCDGKQARKTGTSSPLGLLFDHGCDSLMPVIVGINIFAIAQGGNDLRSILGFSLATTMFMLPTWEEYYVGSLDLPIINGATEGILILISVFLFSSGVDKIWWTSDFYGIPRNYYFLVSMVGVALPLVALTMAKVYSKVEAKGFPTALSKIGMSGLILGTIIFVSIFSPSNVMARKARFMIYIAGFSHAKYMTHMQLAHVANQEIAQKIYTIWIPALLLIGNTVSGMILGETLINEDLLINVLCVFVILAYAAFIVKVINEFKAALGINAFTIKKKTQ